MKKTILVLLACLSNGWLFANHWTPDDSMFEDNMTLTGVIQIDGVEQQSTTLEVGVFCGEECRSTGVLTYFFPTERYVVQLLIFGESGDSLTFKLYDHALEQELDLTSPDTITFTDDGYGALDNPYLLNFTEETEITQTIALSQGWNWCSFNVEITLDDLEAALVEALPDTTITIKSQTQNVKYQNGRWAGSLTALNMAQMYMISVTTDCEISLEGIPIDPSGLTFTINNGANWIAFPFSESIAVADYFGSFPVNNDQVKSQSQNARYQSDRWGGQLNTLMPGKGYLYISNTQGTRIFTFPASAK